MGDSYVARRRLARVSRDQEVQRLAAHLQDRSFPRLQMSLVVATTGGVGLLASFLMLKAGVESMVLRYPLALLIAYAGFMLMMWLWLRTSSEDYDEVLVDAAGHSIDAADAMVRVASRSRVVGFESGGGGDFGGGGASASYDTGEAGPLVAPVHAGGASHGASWAGTGSSDAAKEAGGWFSDLDIRALAVILLAAMAVGVALASVYVIYIAPTLFAELLFDGVLSYRLYARLRNEERAHWLGTAAKKTVGPLLATAALLVAVALGFSTIAPGAKSMGEVIAMVAARGQN